MVFTRGSTGDTWTQALAQQLIKALEGDAGAGQPISLTALNDVAHYALALKNMEATKSYCLQCLNHDDTVIFRVGEGVPYFGVAPTFNAGAEIPHAGLADDAVEDNNIKDGEVTLAKLPDGVLTANVAGRAKMADGFVNAAKVATDAVETAKIKNLNVTTAKLAADAVDGTKLADNAVDSEHYTDGSIDRVHLAADIVDGTKIANDSIDSEHYVNGSIDTAHIGNLQVTAAKVAADVATQAELNTHAALTAAGTHGSTTAATANKIVHRDASGRAKVAAPGAATDIALKSTVTDDIATHAALSAAGTHGSTTAATANKLVHRDAAGRAKVAAPGAASDVALKSTVTADIATHAALTAGAGHANRTRKFFVPAVSGYDQTAGTDITNNSTGEGFHLVDEHHCSVFGYSMVPEDFASGMTIAAVVIPGIVGNIYGKCQIKYGKCGENSAAHDDAIGYSAVAVASGTNNCIHTVTLAHEATGDILRCIYTRAAENALDTTTGIVYFPGWLVEYTADS